MGIFAGRHPKTKVMNDDGIERDMYYPTASGSSVGGPAFFDPDKKLPERTSYLSTTGTYGNLHGQPVDAWGKPADLSLSDDLIDKLWEKMYSQPVLVRCPHCDSVNVVTSPTCVQCGAPMGKAQRIGK